MTVKILVIAGGVGGAKIALGFSDFCKPSNLSIIGNVADDWEFHGLWVSPDIDTLTYTLAGLVDPDKGWGVSDESFRALNVLKKLGEDTWMQLGDQDLGLHIYRTNRRRRGDKPSDIALSIASSLGVLPKIIIPTDNDLQTRINTSKGWMAFQEYFVREKCSPEVTGVSVLGNDSAKITESSIAAIKAADLIIIAPSNPIVSILPIVDIPGFREALINRKGFCVAVSPIVGGKAIKGPAVSMMKALGHLPNAVGVARIYKGLIDAMVIDEVDTSLTPLINELGHQVWLEQTVMRTRADKKNLAKNIVQRFKSVEE